MLFIERTINIPLIDSSGLQGYRLPLEENQVKRSDFQTNSREINMKPSNLLCVWVCVREKESVRERESGREREIWTGKWVNERKWVNVEISCMASMGDVMNKICRERANEIPMKLISKGFTIVIYDDDC